MDKVIKYFYEVNYVVFYYYDETDKENVEDVFFAGYFSTQKKALEAIKQSAQYGNVIESNYKIKKRKVVFETQPEVLYRAYHEYAVKTPNDDYIDYSYVFSPKATLKETEDLCDILRKKKKYCKQSNRDYSTFPPDGFGIEKVEIDKLLFHG